MSSNAHAQANSTEVEALGNGWFIWATWGGMGINNCHISKSAPNGTKLEFSFSVSNGTSMIKLTNENWRSLGNSETHRVKVAFAPEDIQVLMDMEAMNVTALFRGLMHQFRGQAMLSFLNIMQMQNAVTFSRVHDGRESPLATFDLKGADRAGASLDNCVRIRSAEMKAEKDADPFSD